MFENINQENLNASLRYLDKMGDMEMNQLRETDPEAAKRQEQMTELFKDEDFVSKFMDCDEKEDMIRLCAEHGFAMSMEELDALLAQANSMVKNLADNDGELNEEDLEQVAGGAWTTGQKVCAGIGFALTAVVSFVGSMFAFGKKRTGTEKIKDGLSDAAHSLDKKVGNAIDKWLK